MSTPFFQRIRKGFNVSASRGATLNQVELPNDVKEGDFTVLAVKGNETQRYVIELGNLTNLAFISLLEAGSGRIWIPAKRGSLSSLSTS
ncbi:hypothetical protein V6N13_041523 [Hibiscus sabdariffa]|uniref:Uncharacterized protein n=1 Tax=Hibiscus sabdariffa TaxID=183260 RepID=A0ABR2RBJ9_9ROSI